MTKGNDHAVIETVDRKSRGVLYCIYLFIKRLHFRW